MILKNPLESREGFYNVQCIYYFKPKAFFTFAT